MLHGIVAHSLFNLFATLAGWYKPHSVLRRAVGHGQLSSCPQLPGEPGGATFSGSPGSAPVTRAPGRRSRPCPSLTGHLRRARPSPWLPNRRPTGAARIASPPSSKHGAKGQAAPRRAGDLRRGSGRWRRLEPKFTSSSCLSHEEWRKRRGFISRRFLPLLLDFMCRQQRQQIYKYTGKKTEKSDFIHSEWS